MQSWELELDHQLIWWLNKYHDIDDATFIYDPLADFLCAFLQLLASSVSSEPKNDCQKLPDRKKD